MSTSRRDFLKTLGGMALLTIVPRQVLGGPKFTAPSDQLTKGIIGVGGIGKSSYHFTSNKDCRLVAVCDVDRKHLESAVALGQKKFGETLEAYSDFRRLITDPNIDIVHIATPPHWHGIMAVEAAKAGAHIATVPYKVIMQMISHPLTTSGIERFLKDWEGVPKK